FNILSGLSFKKIEVEGVFRIKNLKIFYDLIPLFIYRSIENISVDSFMFTQNIFEGEEKEGVRIKRFSFPEFFIEDLRINFLEFVDKDKSYKIKNIKGFLKISKGTNFISILSLESLKPYPFCLKAILKGNMKKQNMKIIQLENKVFKTKGEVLFYYPVLEIKLKNTKIYNFYFDFFEGKIKIKDDDIDIIYFEGKEKRCNFSISGRVKNFKNFDKMTIEIASYLKGKYLFKTHLFDFEIISELKGTKEHLESQIYIENLNVDQFKGINGYSKFSFFYKKNVFKIDTLNLKLKGGEFVLSGEYPKDLKFKINIDKKNILPYIKGAYGEIFGIYKKEDEKIKIVAYGELKELEYRNFRIPQVKFTFGKEDVKEDFITIDFDSLYYKNFLIGGANLNIKRQDTLFFTKIIGYTSFAGYFEEKGIFKVHKDFYSFRDSIGKINLELKENILKCVLSDIEILNSRIYSDLFFDFENKYLSIVLNLRGLNLEKVKIKDNLILEGNFDLDLSFKRFKDTTSLNFNINSPSLKLNEIAISNFLVSGKGDEKELRVNMKGKIMEGEMEVDGLLYNLEKFLKSPEYEAELIMKKIPIAYVQKFLNFKLINFTKGDISANIKIENGKRKGDIVLEDAEGEFLYPFLSFHNSSLFMSIENNKINGRMNGLSGKGKWRGTLEAIFKQNKIDSSNISLDLREIPVIYDFIEGKVNGKFNISIYKDRVNLSSNLKVEEAFIMPVFREKESTPYPSNIFLNLLFKSDGKIFIFNEWIDAELKGDVRVSKTDLINYYINGELEVINGKIFYLGNVFDIKEGRLFLKGENEFLPEINLRAELPYIINNENVIIVLEIKGSLKNPDFKIYSEPISFDESNLIKALTLGEVTAKPFSEIGMRGIVIGEKIFSTQVKKLAKVAEFSLLSGTNPSLMLGTYVSPDIYIKYQHDFLSFYKDIFLIKYFLNPRFSIYSKRERTGEITTGVEIEIRF
ncbi:MAG: translocation/assembly module TamB, partial [Candidatus Omnitrophica bacterium]|nr:translocation/assembly module TamB [Candidatus Omnitrophota bacterium]